MDRSLLKQELKRDEGESLDAYQDSVGLWTIGVGHLLGTTKRMVAITADEQDALLERDIDHAITGAIATLGPEFSTLDEVRQRAVVNMVFNLGSRLGRFQGLLDAIRNAEWDRAKGEALDSIWARQVGRRAVRIADMLETGVA